MANLDKEGNESLLTERLKIEDLPTQLFVCGGFLGCVRQQCNGVKCLTSYLSLGVFDTQVALINDSARVIGLVLM